MFKLVQMANEFEEVAKCFKYVKFEEAYRLMCIESPPNDALTHLSWKHNKIVCQCEVTAHFQLC